MKSTLLAGILLLAGCQATSGPTNDPNTPGWVKTLDSVLSVKKAADGTVSQDKPADPLGGSVPLVTGIFSLAALAWATIRSLSKSVPQESHDAAIQALGSSQPTAVTTVTPVKPS
jgi:hypothetical protein